MMRPARLTLVLGTIGALSIAALMSAQQEKPAAPMQIEKTLIGIYGVLSSVVSWRARDRTPYGAWRRTGDTEADVRAVLTRTDGYWIAFGLAGAGALTRLMSSLLFGTGPLDPATYAAVLVVLTAAALLASYVPARRAVMVNRSRRSPRNEAGEQGCTTRRGVATEVSGTAGPIRTPRRGNGRSLQDSPTCQYILV